MQQWLLARLLICGTLKQCLHHKVRAFFVLGLPEQIAGSSRA